MNKIESTSFYETVLENLPVPLIVYRKNEFIYVNSSAVNLFNAQSSSEILRRNITDLVVDKNNIGKSVRICCQRLDGFKFMTDVEQTPIQIEGEECYQVIFKNIELNDCLMTSIAPAPALLSKVLDTASIAVIMINKNQNIIFFSQYAEHVFGYQSQEIVGQSLALLMRDMHQATHPHHVETFNREGKNWRSMSQREIECLRKDGTSFTAEISISKLNLADEVFFTAFISDIMSRKQAEKVRDEKYALIELLHHTTLDLSSTLDLYEILDRILSHIVNLVPQVSANIMLLRRNVAWVAQTLDYDEKLSIHWMKDQRLVIEELKSLLTVVQTKKMLLINEIDEGDIWLNSTETGWIKSYIGIPIYTADQVIGVINIYSATPQAFTIEQSNAIQAMANESVLVILNAQLYASEMKQRILAQIFQKIIHNLKQNSSIQHTLNQALVHLEQIIDYYDIAAILLTKNEDLTVAGWHIPKPSQNIQTSNFSLTIPSPAPDTLQSKVLRGQTLVLDDAYLDEGWADIMSLDFEVRGWIGVPLIIADMVVGMLCISSRYPYAYSVDDISSVTAFSQQVSLAVENTRIHGELEHSLSDLRITQNHLYRLMRLSTASEIIRGLTHQISNPLVVIMAHVHLLMKRIEPNTPMYRSCESIRSATERVGNTVQDLRDFANPSSYNRERVNINTSIQFAVNLLRHQITKNAVIDLNLASDLPLIEVSHQHLEDVWINLLLNAKEAVNERPDPKINIESVLNVAQNRIEIRFMDNGAGIPPEHLENIFTPLFTTKQYKTGLGLSICQDIIARHDGQIYVSSILNEGSTFKIVLPLSN